MTKVYEIIDGKVLERMRANPTDAKICELSLQFEDLLKEIGKLKAENAPKAKLQPLLNNCAEVANELQPLVEERTERDEIIIRFIDDYFETNHPELCKED